MTESPDPRPHDADPSAPAPPEGSLVPNEETDDTSPAHRRGSLLEKQAVRVPLLLIGVFALIAAAIMVLSRDDITAQTAPDQVARTLPTRTTSLSEPFTLTQLDLHPDQMYAGELAGAFAQGPSIGPDHSQDFDDFRTQLDIYTKRQGLDDNFTIRVLDNRSSRTLETFVLREERTQFELTGRADWDAVDRARRAATGRLTRKWQDRGIPRDAISVRWGRANQVLEARERDEPYIQYEIQLARRLGFSLLATEIGTVETFNQDHLISSVGARSRYQMMPDILRRFDVETYRIPVTTGGTVLVREEQNPLLAMQPSMMLLRGYTNSVGHEVPGISSYHTGPGNIFTLYEEYLRSNRGRLNPRTADVVDAYMWGVTDGFEQVRARSSFGPASRAYVLQAYGSLRATEDETVDPDAAIRAERVRLKEGVTLSLADLMRRLQGGGSRLDWGAANTDANLYERFRALNPHIELPIAGRSDPAYVPAGGNLRLSRSTPDGTPIKFFLPHGASAFLSSVGVSPLDDDELFTFDENTFSVEPNEILAADRQYDELVRDIRRFGFTTANRNRLTYLKNRMFALAEQNPTFYRRTQAGIIRIHDQVWGTRAFRELAAAVDRYLAVGPTPSTPRADSIRMGDVDRLAPRPPAPLTLPE